MVSTYLSFDLVNRDLLKSINQVAKQSTVVNDTKYYQDNIGKVTNIDEFLDDYRLYSYAMKAYGLEDMIYAKAFMKKVLESDLSDDNSFANRLTDDRYKSIASSFNFAASSSSTAAAQSSGQMEKLFDTYDQTVASLNDTTAEETRYFKVMLTTPGNIKDVDGFLRNERLREYMFTAYNYNGSYYNYNVIRGVLTSDPNDPNSYYQNSFGGKLDQYNAAVTEDTQLANRQVVVDAIASYQESITLGNEAKTDKEQEIADLEAQRGDPAVDQDELETNITAKNEELTSIVSGIEADQAALEAEQDDLDDFDPGLVPIEQTAARRAELAKILKDPTMDPNFAGFMKMLAEDFQFNADGSVPATGILSTDKLQEMIGGYFNRQTRMTRAEAIYNEENFLAKLATATSVTDLTSDPRVVNYLKVAFDLNESYIVKSTIERILVNDGGIVEQYATTRPQYKALYEAFNFASDGTPKDGAILAPTANLDGIKSNYMSRWDDKLDAAQEKAENFFKLEMDKEITSLDDFFSTDASASLKYALDALGIGSTEYSAFKLKKVLKSDLSDPKSYVYQLKDERLVKFAKLFNFTSDGKLGMPVLAQSNSAITNVAKDYILRQTRFLTGDELDAAKKKAEAQSTYYTETIQRIETRDELLKDRKMLDILLISKGIDPATVTNDFLKKAFTSDLNDPQSFVNTQENKQFAQIVGSFNFNAKGDIDRSKGGGVQNGGEVAATESAYVRQMLEAQEGEENNGVRLALYFQRMADTITDPYVILGDEALMEFFRVTFQLPAEIGNMDVDQQAKLVKKKLDLADLSDPEKLDKLIKRFTVMYDLENSAASSPIVSLMSDGSGGISADTLWALSQLKSG